MVLGLSKQPNWLSTIHLGNYLNLNLPTDFTEEPNGLIVFEYINKKAEALLIAGQPVISVDTKKKEMVGQYKGADK